MIFLNKVDIMKKYPHVKSVFEAILPLLFLLTSCSYKELLNKANLKNPEVEVEKVRFSGLSFDSVNLLFDLKIKNPNGIGVNLAGFDYDFQINDNSFVSGRQENGLKIVAGGENVIGLPVTLKFKELFQTYKTLRDQDSLAYKLACSFSFDLPVFGAVKVPVSKSGMLPVLKLPSVSLAGVKLNKLSFSGADMKLQVKLKNDNPFKLFVGKFKYEFAGNSKNWISGVNEKSMTVGGKGESIIEIPVSLNFLQAGRSVYQLLTGDRNLNYKLLGSVDFSTSLPIIGEVKLLFDQSGQVKIR
ncbi:MAG TPA: hypothetical protein ENH29_04175 [Bacteroidetes bacterium]|nr:hypothetical protein [Bacteroidota bacterium]